jgi:hypothetical protein
MIFNTGVYALSYDVPAQIFQPWRSEDEWNGKQPPHLLAACPRGRHAQRRARRRASERRALRPGPGARRRLAPPRLSRQPLALGLGRGAPVSGPEPRAQRRLLLARRRRAVDRGQRLRGVLVPALSPALGLAGGRGGLRRGGVGRQRPRGLGARARGGGGALGGAPVRGGGGHVGLRGARDGLGTVLSGEPHLFGGGGSRPGSRSCTAPAEGGWSWPGRSRRRRRPCIGTTGSFWRWPWAP